MSYIGVKPANVALTASDITDGIISLAKMTVGTDGNLITYDTSGNPAAVATGTSGHFLKSQGADSVPVFAAPAAGGKILQVLTATTTTRVNVATTAYTDIGLSIAITPAATSSKIYAIWKISANMDSSRGYGSKLLRDTTAVFTSQGLNSMLSQTNSFRLHGVYMHLDSPSSTSEIVYKVQCGTNGGSQVDFQEADNSDLMIMEVGG